MNIDISTSLKNAYEHIQHECYNDALSSILEAQELVDVWKSIHEKTPEDEFVAFISTKSGYFMQICMVNEDGDLFNTDTGESWGYSINDIEYWKPCSLPKNANISENPGE